MTPHRRALPAYLTAAVVAFAWSQARAQEEGPGDANDIVARIPGEFFRRPYLSIADADPGGQVRFEFDPEAPARRSGGGDFFNPGDGHALMLVRPAAAPDDVQ